MIKYIAIAYVVAVITSCTLVSIETIDRCSYQQETWIGLPIFKKLDCDDVNKPEQTSKAEIILKK
jgi:hypothetical protein